MISGLKKDGSRQVRSVTPEIHFSNKSDQEHYLNVDSTYKRWRSASPTASLTPTSLNSDSFIFGDTLPYKEVESPGPEISFTNNTEEGREGLFATRVKSSIECLDKTYVKSKRHRHTNPNPMGADTVGHTEIFLSNENIVAHQSYDKVTTTPDINDELPLVEERSVETENDVHPHPRKVANEHNRSQDVPSGITSSCGLLVLTLDNSKAASLSRCCKWGGHFRKIPDGGEVTLTELREMATRQQHQIETQQQLLVAREQRLKYLKQQEGRSAQISLEAERLRRLRERVEAQEAKLRRLRALRGQVDSSLLNAASLSTDLEAMRHLFSEKEKELVDAAAKVEALTRQLEEVRAGRNVPSCTSEHTSDTQNQHHLQIHQQELEKLRRELLYRNSINREASSRVASQREALSSRKEEISRIDKRIAELQQRLYRKRFLNQQLATQISAATQAKQAQLKAVHQKGKRDGKQDNSADDIMAEGNKVGNEESAQFERGNQDPKYQTLPYNTKFSSGGRNLSEGIVFNPPATGTSAPPGGVVTRTVHSIPTNLPAKGVASAPSNSGLCTGALPGQTIDVTSIAPTHSSSVASLTGRTSQHNSSPKFDSCMQLQSQSPQQQQLEQNLHQSQLPPKMSVTEDSYINAGKVVSSQSHTSQPSQNPSVVQKLNSGMKNGAQNKPSGLASAHPLQYSNKDVENVRAFGFPVNSSRASPVSMKASLPPQDEFVEPVAVGGKMKPTLPPKPTPTKPTPPPRQKGDPMAGSTESLNMTGVPKNTGQSRPQVLRYASQSLILSTYNQQQQQDQKNDLKRAGEKQQIQNLLQEQQIKLQSQPQQEKHSQQHLSPNHSSSSLNQTSYSTQHLAKDALKALETTGGSDYKEMNGKEKLEASTEKVHISINRRIEMPPDFLFPENATPPSDLLGRPRAAWDDGSNTETTKAVGEDLNDLSIAHYKELNQLIKNSSIDDNTVSNFNNKNNNIITHGSLSTDIKDMEILKMGSTDSKKECSQEGKGSTGEELSSDSPMQENLHIKEEEQVDDMNCMNFSSNSVVVRRSKKGNLKNPNVSRVPRRVSFDPLALLLDASLEGELELVKRTATEVPNPSAANDEGITALHNAICAGHLDIVTFLVTFGCDVNAQDSDGWTPLHCAASCNNVAMVRFLVEHGACVLATTLSDHETAAEKCEQDEEGYDGCSQYLYSVQEKLGIMNGGVVFTVYDYESQNDDELNLNCGDSLTIIRRGDEYEREWWWAAKDDLYGYVPRNLLGLYPRVKNIFKES